MHAGLDHSKQEAQRHFGFAADKSPQLSFRTPKMKRPSAPKRQPPPSGYQKLTRKTTVRLVLLCVVLALAVAAAFYFYQRRSLIP